MNPLDNAWSGLFLACCAALRADPDGKWANSFFREAWPRGGTHHTPGIDTDVCYFALSERTGDKPPFQYSYGEDTLLTFAQTPAQCNFYFYGPNSEHYADRMRRNLMLDTATIKDGVTYPNPRAILRRHGIILMLPLPNLVSLPEELDGQWRQRCDFVFPFLYAAMERTQVPCITEPPEINTSISEKNQGVI